MGVVEGERRAESEGGMKKKIDWKDSGSTNPHHQEVSPSQGWLRDGEGQGVTEGDMDGPLVTTAQKNHGGSTGWFRTH